RAHERRRRAPAHGRHASARRRMRRVRGLQARARAGPRRRRPADARAATDGRAGDGDARAAADRARLAPRRRRPRRADRQVAHEARGRRRRRSQQARDGDAHRPLPVIGGWSSYYGADAIRWWPDVDGSEFDGSPSTPRHEKLIPAAYLVWMRNAARRAQWFYYARLYGGFDQALAGPIGGLDPISTIPGSAPYNVIRSTTNTLTAKVIKNRPSPYFLPVDADSKLRKRVQYLNRFSVGLL